ncbi:MAG: DUF4339 domain-containing protein [Prevotellaceae bacterium]|nr:DUF4339 domain-containing protein [Candidatus Minthosoma equi]
MNEDFYGSIDKLVEFGLSGQLAQSMMATMNSVMANMNMPNYSVINQIAMENSVAVKPVSQKRFYAAINEEIKGPLTADELQHLMATREVTEDTLVWYQGLPGWAQAGVLDELRIMLNNIPPTL